MSVTFTDDGLVTWEAFASGGPQGLSVHPKIVFQCVSDARVRPRFVELDGDEADAEKAVHAGDEARLRALLKEARELP